MSEDTQYSFSFEGASKPQSQLSAEDSFFGYIKTVYDDQDELLGAVRHLHFPEGFDADLTYGNGQFWRKQDRPRYCFDIEPMEDFVKSASSTDLPLQPESLGSAVFDPPFLTYIKSGRGHSSIMAERFSGYWSYKELQDHYTLTLRECHRVLKPKGRVLFKCQDIIHNHKHHSTHSNVICWAADEGFSVVDIFILTAAHRMPTKAACHGVQRQRHARNFHSYFIVFEKITNNPKQQGNNKWIRR